MNIAILMWIPFIVLAAVLISWRNERPKIKETLKIVRNVEDTEIRGYLATRWAAAVSALVLGVCIPLLAIFILASLR